MTQAALARALGVTPQAVSQWVAGKVAPERDNAVALQALLGIPMTSWSEEDPSAGHDHTPDPVIVNR